MNSSYIETVSKKIDSGTKKRLEHDTRLFHIFAFGIIGILFGALTLAGAFSGGLASLQTILPRSTLFTVSCLMLALIFIDRFMLLSYCRGLLRAIHELEKRVEESKHDA